MKNASYDLEMPTLFEQIDAVKPKRICIQLPDGLKPRAQEIVAAIEAKYPEIKVIIWLGSNFGACDIPLGLDHLDIDMLVMWGHNRFVKVREGWDK